MFETGGKIMSGNGIRAARREKFLSRRLENGASMWVPANKFWRRHVHHIDRRACRQQLAATLAVVEDFHDEKEFRKFVAPVRDNKAQFNWMYKEASRCGSVHATARRVYFMK